MNFKYLSVDSDVKLAESEAAVWKSERGIDMERVDTMTQGIEKLKKNNYLYVGINSNVVDFMPLLRAMRSVTKCPIFIATDDCNYSAQKESFAVTNGANMYGRFQKTTSENIEVVMAHITKISLENENPSNPEPSNILVFKELLIAPLQHSVYVWDKKINLTKTEYDILYYLALNRNIIITYEQLCDEIWKEREPPTNNLVWNHVFTLRQKLKSAKKYLINEKSVGYSFSTKL
ncbi:MAG: winged helix-turn-helix domain-containing protein [Oscillospiraceae bacterium]|nr:winged helix-turn-helix domain-containing protein [Oscillospiraceae bacterium]